MEAKTTRFDRSISNQLADASGMKKSSGRIADGYTQINRRARKGIELIAGAQRPTYLVMRS